MRLLPLLNLRSACAMSASHTVACRGFPFCCQRDCSTFVVIVEEAIVELPHCQQSSFRGFQVGRVPCRRPQRHLDGAIALLLCEFDLPDSAVLIVLTLHDQDRNANMSECVTKIQSTKLRVEPGIAPIVKCVVGISVDAGEVRSQISRIE